MKFDFLPQRYVNALANCCLDNLYEIRLRQEFAVIVNVDGKNLYLSDDGFTLLETNAITCAKNDIEEVIKTVTEFSTYAFNDKIKCGYLTTSNGVRIGLAGECVFENSKIITIKNVTSLNIRIPHEIFGCSDKIINYIVDGDKIQNTLIISPPFYGKTTILKDITRKINEMDLGSLLLIDERGEFIGVKGKNIDVIKYSDKLYAFEYGVRVMSPKVVITDELISKTDWDCVKKAVSSGVNIIASSHGNKIADLKLKDHFLEGVFDRYIILDFQDGGGRVFNRELNLL